MKNRLFIGGKFVYHDFVMKEINQIQNENFKKIMTQKFNKICQEQFTFKLHNIDWVKTLLGELTMDMTLFDMKQLDERIKTFVNTKGLIFALNILY